MTPIQNLEDELRQHVQALLFVTSCVQRALERPEPDWDDVAIDLNTIKGESRQACECVGELLYLRKQQNEDPR